MANNIIDKIQISGQSYDVKDSSAATVVELTQQEYDDLPSSAKTGNTLFVITDAQAGDLTNYYTKTETNTLLNGKQATLVSGTNIKTINNESLLGSGNIDIQGGGTTYSAGTNISIANDTINCTLPLTVGNSNTSLSLGTGNNLSNSTRTLAIGDSNSINNLSANSLVGGMRSSINYNCARSIAFGYQANVGAQDSYSMGNNTKTSNVCETAFGKYNASNTGSTTADKTLFSVGNGTSNSARHNAFEIRQNGDIYITSGGTDIKLQDNLGGSSITVDTALDSGSTNPVENRVIYNKIDEVEQVTAAGLNAVNDKFDGLKLQQITQSDYNNLQTKDPSTLYIIVN